MNHGRYLGLMMMMLHLSSAEIALSQVAQPVDRTLQPVASVVIPEASAIAVIFKTPMTYVPKGQKQNYPVTGFLAEPLKDDRGNVVVPVNALVTLYLKPTDEGALISGNGIVIGGRLMSITTSSILVPAQTETVFFGSEYVPTPGIVNRVSTSFLSIVTDSDALKPELRFSLGLGLAIASGLSTPKAKSPPAVVTIGENSVYVLTLTAPVTLPSHLIPVTEPTPNQQMPTADTTSIKSLVSH
ncbi:hypothetical protein C7B64_12340 [Merismopedia glauca CCAP 1448/3]|uniref:SbsA Ig-like domain-containing protein n=3 Tax=Merismopedia TaxID=53402 RepID=A0A2T1C2Z2_9CYAN|nr:hypothetical protein C7B64_12340 [Merismopedia glauca CCAP 1448/3]